VIEGWLPLSPEGGSLRVVVEYEPHGLEPREGDVVFFEAFARSHRSLVFPPNEPMVVKVRACVPKAACVYRVMLRLTCRSCGLTGLVRRAPAGVDADALLPRVALAPPVGRRPARDQGQGACYHRPCNLEAAELPTVCVWAVHAGAPQHGLRDRAPHACRRCLVPRDERHGETRRHAARCDLTTLCMVIA
jgi:hypothetical protein